MKANTISHSYLTPSEVADLLGVTKRTIHTLTAKGLLPVVKLTGKTVRYPRAAVEASLEKLTVNAGR
ncbi:MAG: helix-turn-helix domain-containing protein [Chthoniobacterales bacterium]